MERLCMRPGCDRSVVARLTYDTISCQVWLDQVRERPGPAQEICELHTSRLTVPRGWMLCDRRDESPALFVPEPPAEVSAPTEPTAASPEPSTASVARPKRPAPEPQPDLFGLPVIAEELRPPVSGFEPIEQPVEPRVERRVAQTAPVAPPAPRTSLAPVTPAAAFTPDVPTSDAPTPDAPTPDAPEGDGVPEGDAVPDAEPAARNGSRGGERNGTGRHNGDAVVDGEPDELDDEDLPESLQATSPLLSRAFRATGHQRSVLTQTLLNDPE